MVRAGQKHLLPTVLPPMQAIFLTFSLLPKIRFGFLCVGVGFLERSPGASKFGLPATLKK